MSSSIVDRALFLDVLREPTALAEFDLRQWDEFLPMANQLGMLPYLVARLDAAGISDLLPSRIAIHLESARLRSRQQKRVVLWEAEQLEKLLADVGVPIVLLKGAAYLLSGLDIAAGRMYSDIDIMVPPDSIEEVERTLKRHGWEQPGEDTRQDHYFRRWMHEVLPLVHRRRGTKLDLHHNILPSVDRLRFDPGILFESARPIDGRSGIYVLAPVDMTLHLIIHLFRNGDYRRALRDLVDLDKLLEGFSRLDHDFFDVFVLRAKELSLETPCYLAFRYARKYLNTPVPARAATWAEAGEPILPPVWLIDRLFEYASFPSQLTRGGNARRLSLWFLERYPLNLLRKSVLPKLERRGIFLIHPKGRIQG